VQVEDLTFDSQRDRPFSRPLLETAVVTEWVKAFRGAGLEPPLSFWR
jgi:hypothetical protein